MKFGSYRVQCSSKPDFYFDSAIEAHDIAEQISLKAEGPVKVQKLGKYSGTYSGKYSTVAVYRDGKETEKMTGQQSYKVKYPSQFFDTALEAHQAASHHSRELAGVFQVEKRDTHENFAGVFAGVAMYVSGQEIFRKEEVQDDQA